MVWGDYWVIGLAPDYSWSVVGDPGRDYLWILARAPHLDDDSMAAARAVARDNGFDVSRLLPTSQQGRGATMTPTVIRDRQLTRPAFSAVSTESYR